MNQPDRPTLKYHTTESYPCSYIPTKEARSEIAIPDQHIDTQSFAKLIQSGFRRSGHYIYRPSCDDCDACLSVRIDISQFKPNRAQRRTWKRHQNLVPEVYALQNLPEHFALYQRYQQARHHSETAAPDYYEQYEQFLLQSHVNSRLIEFRDNTQLCAVSIIDVLPDGLSSVYTFFDPDIPNASFGTYSILWQINYCRELGLPYLYLGYWIKDNRKMSYKTNFQPLEALIDNEWIPFR